MVKIKVIKIIIQIIVQTIFSRFRQRIINQVKRPDQRLSANNEDTSYEEGKLT